MCILRCLKTRSIWRMRQSVARWFGREVYCAKATESVMAPLATAMLSSPCTSSHRSRSTCTVPARYSAKHSGRYCLHVCSAQQILFILILCLRRQIDAVIIFSGFYLFFLLFPLPRSKFHKISRKAHIKTHLNPTECQTEHWTLKTFAVYTHRPLY